MASAINGLHNGHAEKFIARRRNYNITTLPVFLSALSPAGPHKGWGGSIDDRISCGGVVVMPGDIILGDDDGVTVVPLARADVVLEASLARLAYEAEILEKLATWADMSGLFPSPELEIMS